MVVYSYTGLFSKRTGKSSKKKKNSIGKRLSRFTRRTEKWLASHPNLVGAAMGLANLGINAKLAFGGYKIKHE
jgi:hypothetical protein